MRNYPFKTIVACLSILWHSPHLWAADAVTPDTAVLDTIEVRGKRLTKDQKGEAQQYSKNVSNAYLGKEYLENATAPMLPATSSRGSTVCTT